MWFQEKPLTKSLQRGEDPHFDQVSEEKKWPNFPYLPNCGEMMSCGCGCGCQKVKMKVVTALIWCAATLKGKKSCSCNPRKGLSVKDMGVFTWSVGSSSVLGVSSRSAAQHRRSCHSHRGVFVLLREPIQAAAQSWDSSPAPVLNEGSAVFPCPDQTPHPSCAPSPSHPFLPFPLFPQNQGRLPPLAVPFHCFVSSPSFISSFGPWIKMFLVHMFTLQVQTCSKLTTVAAAMRFFLD